MKTVYFYTRNVVIKKPKTFKQIIENKHKIETLNFEL